MKPFKTAPARNALNCQQKRGPVLSTAKTGSLRALHWPKGLRPQVCPRSKAIEVFWADASDAHYGHAQKSSANWRLLPNKATSSALRFVPVFMKMLLQHGQPWQPFHDWKSMLETLSGVSLF